ncbi:MAG TPA: MarR family transcriptional regulator [Chryseosolibacter sp.]
MSLETDIQQKSFRNEYQKAILNIIYTQNYLVSRMTEVFKKFDITRQQYNVLRILRGQYPDPATINLIKERMLEKMSDTSRIVERLRLKGLIQREDGKSDKRAAEISITPAGLELLRKMQPEVDELDSVLTGLSLDEARELNHLLDKVRNAETAETEKLLHSLELLNQTEKF